MHDRFTDEREALQEHIRSRIESGACPTLVAQAMAANGAVVCAYLHGPDAAVEFLSDTADGIADMARRGVFMKTEGSA